VIVAEKKVAPDDLAMALALRARALTDKWFFEHSFPPDVADFKEVFLAVIEQLLIK
jgi:hypothetical protein